ncbi:TraB/GumN family protein [Agrilutibacter solisilvae]|uniref:TraB/GumN family protein n=1 Tax=Agrilutibacter solisilvae TaxID=2763317 RepID=A0A974XYT9_9GAMM|nr:TraB/GumN family protein [Lysobacter solisilvae]QSX78291.1 TraB/GumN family protein [Lysobacter solisilvae]
MQSNSRVTGQLPAVRVRPAVAVLALALVAPCVGVQAQDTSAVAAPVSSSVPIRDAEPVIVSGALPGRGMWKVSKGEHTMYVLGTLSPLPRDMEWTSRDVVRVLEEADEVMTGYGVRVDADVGFFGKLAMLPNVLGARKNPDDRLLKDVVSPADYARWLVLKQRYIGRDSGVEKYRPVFAAAELYQEAIEDRGMSTSSVIDPVLNEAVKRRKIKVTAPRLTIKVPDPKRALKSFRDEQLGDRACFSKTLDNLEADLDRMADRANAWSVGDVEALRLVPQGDQYEACMDALTGAQALRKYGPADLEGAMRSVWLEAAEKALAGNQVTLATLPMRELLKPGNYLETLQAKGYTVEAP